MAKVRQFLGLGCLLALLAVEPAWAQRKMSVAQLDQFVRSSMELKHSDKQVADVLKNVQLTERLDGRVMEVWQGLGAGPRTLEALRTLVAASASLGQAASPLAGGPGAAAKALPVRPAPTEVEERRVLAEVTKYALEYTANLPNFTCIQVTRRYVSQATTGSKRPLDEFHEQLSFVDGEESYKLLTVNNQPVGPLTREQLGGAVSSGEFGTRLKEIFEPKSKAVFLWERWATLRGQLMHVFAYRVEQKDSAYGVYDAESSRRIIAGYHGNVYADVKTNAVMRVTVDLDGLQNFPVERVHQELDYEPVTIGAGEPTERAYVLPLRAELNSASRGYLNENNTEFRLYRRFSADADIVYDTLEPLPEERFEDQPPK